MKKMFSVIVPIYKVEAFLEKCIESILQQTYENFELILVDDGSPDNCPLICDRYSKKDVRIRTIHKLNGGLVSARNTGLLSAVGDYICYVDGDDWLVPDALQKVKENAIDKYHPDMIIYNMIKEFVSFVKNKLQTKKGKIFAKFFLFYLIYQTKMLF